MGRVRKTLADRIAEQRVRPVEMRDLVGDDEELLEVKEAAKKLSVHPETVRRLIANGSIPAVRISTKDEQQRPAVRITKQSLNLFIRQRIAFRHDLVRIDDTAVVVRERAMDGAA